jgi:hypothetical protein
MSENRDKSSRQPVESSTNLWSMCHWAATQPPGDQDLRNRKTFNELLEMMLDHFQEFTIREMQGLPCTKRVMLKPPVSRKTA